MQGKRVLKVPISDYDIEIMFPGELIRVEDVDKVIEYLTFIRAFIEAGETSVEPEPAQTDS